MAHDIQPLPDQLSIRLPLPGSRELHGLKSPREEKHMRATKGIRFRNAGGTTLLFAALALGGPVWDVVKGRATGSDRRVADRRLHDGRPAHGRISAKRGAAEGFHTGRCQMQ